MSKSQLKKELQHFEKEQIIELLLNLYSARKEAKDYFEYFLNPDPEGVALDIYNKSTKEIWRNKYHRSKGRVSVIKKLIKDFKGLEPGSMVLIKLYGSIIEEVLRADRTIYFSDTFQTMVYSLVDEAVQLAFANEHLQELMELYQFIPELAALYKTPLGKGVEARFKSDIEDFSKKLPG